MMITVWIGFLAFVLLLLALDLGVFHRTAKEVHPKEALAWSAVWIAIGLSFAVFVFFGYENKWFGMGTGVDPVDGVVNGGAVATEKYLTGYVVEKSLSIDNIFVIAMLFSFFAVPGRLQHRVLFWGVLGALVMRGLMIVAGARLIAEFHWVLYLFAAFLILTALKMLFTKEGPRDPSRNIVVRIIKRFLPVSSEYHGDRFLVRGPTPRSFLLTPLAVALILVETTDLIFAVDSIPAIFAITADPFLVFTSNVFAILGLRSLYFALAGMIQKFRYLKTALALVLLLVGFKMIFAGWLKSVLGDRFNLIILLGVLAILAGGVVASLYADRKAGTARGN
ncbi:MAG: TerC/Alx family metal homeostasis membrane protein [Spirochaetes bacterium]|nr:TerC/Alx family metal homeostasis membrane protein [Spirochaetota bacterium]